MTAVAICIDLVGHDGALRHVEAGGAGRRLEHGAGGVLALAVEHAVGDRHDAGPHAGRSQSPDLPPLFETRQMSSIVIAGSSDLHMSWTHSAAAAAAHSASISTPV